jgi:glucose/mannose transport system permease protein
MGRALVYALLVLAALSFLLPVYLVILTALKEPAKITLDTVWRWPDPVYWESFRTAWEAFRPKFQNSLVLATSATLLSALVGALNGYVLAKWPFRGSDLLFALMLFGMFIPLPERSHPPLPVREVHRALRVALGPDPSARGLRHPHRHADL